MNQRMSSLEDEAPPSESKSARGGEQRVSVLVGDRLCSHCGYNLTGQAVLREPHYHMLIVRCPECAAVASVQEYPLLGRWANRWAALLAGLWLLVLVAMWVGSGAAFFGLSVGAAEIATEKHRTLVTLRFSEWQAQNQAKTVGPPANFGYNPAEFRAWWTPETQRQLMRDAGGFFGAIEWGAFWMWLVIAVVAIALGTFWSVALLNRSGIGLMMWGVAIMLVGGAFASVLLIGMAREEPNWTYSAAFEQIAPTMLLLSLGFSAVMVMAGLLMGRRLARWLVRTLLPPRLCQSLALLWTCDGLNPPPLRR